jgi:hypothetical protein
MYKLIDLGDRRLPYAINNRGRVCGVYVWGFYEAFAWSASAGFVELAPGAYRSFGSAINEAGQIAGQIRQDLTPSGRRPFRWTPGAAGAPGTLEVLATPAGFEDSVAFAINSQGHCAGVMEPVSFPPGRNGQLWPSPASNVAIGLHVARAMNDYGQIVGEAAGPAPWNAGLWQPDAAGATSGKTHVIGLPPGATSGDAMSINQYGQIAGSAWGFPAVTTPTGIVEHGKRAFLWGPTSPNGTKGSATSLGTLPHTDPKRPSDSEAHDVNQRSEVVGASNGRAFLYRRGTMYDLNDLIPPDSGWVLSKAIGINDFGWIVGVGFLGYDFHGFVLRPEIPLVELVTPRPRYEDWFRTLPVPPPPGPLGPMAQELAATLSAPSPGARAVMQRLLESDAADSLPEPRRRRELQSTALDEAARMIKRMRRELKR